MLCKGALKFLIRQRVFTFPGLLPIRLIGKEQQVSDPLQWAMVLVAAGANRRSPVLHSHLSQTGIGSHI